MGNYLNSIVSDLQIDSKTKKYIIIIPEKDGNKTRRETSIPIEPHILSIIKKQRNLHNSEYVFPTKNGLMNNTDNIRKHLIRQVLPKLPEIGEATTNDFRHSTCSYIVNNFDLMSAKEILRHTDVKTTMSYYHKDEKKVRKAISILHIKE